MIDKIHLSNKQFVKIINESKFSKETLEILNKKFKEGTYIHSEFITKHFLDFSFSKEKFLKKIENGENIEDILISGFNKIDELIKNGEGISTSLEIARLFSNDFLKLLVLMNIRSDNKDKELFYIKDDEQNIFGYFRIEYNERIDLTTIYSDNNENDQFQYHFGGNIFSLSGDEVVEEYLILNKDHNFIDIDDYFGNDFDKIKKVIELDYSMFDFLENASLKKRSIKKKNSKKIKDDDIQEEFIFDGNSYKKYFIKEKNKEIIEKIVNDFKEVNKSLIKIKLGINGKINIGKVIDKDKVEFVISFFKNYFDDHRLEFIENGYFFDEEIIQKMKVLSENTEFAIEDYFDQDCDKESSLYKIFKEFVEESINSINKLSIASRIYLDEELNKNIFIENAIPKNIEYSMNNGFKKIIKTLLDSHKFRRNTILIGHAGFGKTFGCKVSCELLNLPYYKFSCNIQTQIEEFFGSISQNEQGIVIREKGPLTKAIENGGLFVFDEFNSMPSETIKALNSILDSIQGFKDGDTIDIQISGKNFSIKIHKDFRICLTGNPSEFSEDYGILSRVTNDLSRRSVVLNTTSLLSGKLFNDSFIREYFKNIEINFEIIDENEKEFRKGISNKLIKLTSELQLAIGRGSISQKEDNRFFVLNNKDLEIDSTDEEIYKDVILPISSLICLPIKNILSTFDEVKSHKEILELFMNNHLKFVFNELEHGEMKTFEMIYDKVLNKSE